MKKKTVIILAVVAIAAAYGVHHFRGKSAPEAPKAPPAVNVGAQMLQQQTADVAEEFPGRTTAFKVSEIRPQVNGIIQSRLFTEGSNVKKGQQLYQIDAAPYQAAYDSAKATLAKAEAMVKSTEAKTKRYKSLVKIEAISKQDYDDIIATSAQAVADVGVAKAALATATINLNYTKVYAPISGRIGKSIVTEGALVSASQADALTSITQLTPIYVDITQASEDVQRLRHALKDKAKQAVTLLFQNSDEPYKHTGTLQFSDITVDPTTGSVQLRTLFPNPDSDLLPGMFVRARINVPTENVILVPQRATVRGADGALTVWVIGQDDTVQPVKIKSDRTVGDTWLVRAGLENGVRIVTEGMQKLKPGATVKVVEPEAAKAAEAAPAAETKPAEGK